MENQVGAILFMCRLFEGVLAILIGLVIWRYLKPPSSRREQIQDKLMNGVRLSGIKLLYFYTEPKVPFKHEVYENLCHTNHDFVFVSNGVHEIVMTYHRDTKQANVSYSRRVDKNLAWLMTCHAMRVLAEQGDEFAWVQRYALFNNFEVSWIREHHNLPKFGEKSRKVSYVG